MNASSRAQLAQQPACGEGIPGPIEDDACSLQGGVHSGSCPQEAVWEGPRPSYSRVWASHTLSQPLMPTEPFPESPARRYRLPIWVNRGVQPREEIKGSHILFWNEQGQESSHLRGDYICLRAGAGVSCTRACIPSGRGVEWPRPSNRHNASEALRRANGTRRLFSSIVVKHTHLLATAGDQTACRRPRLKPSPPTPTARHQLLSPDQESKRQNLIG